jgi:hypothetical protein
MSTLRPWSSEQDILTVPLGGQKNTRSVAFAARRNRSFMYQKTWRTSLPAAQAS